MASIHPKTDSPYWWASFRDAKSRPRSKSTKILREPSDRALTQSNRAAAQQLADEYERKARSGIPIDAPLDVQSHSLGIPALGDSSQVLITARIPSFCEFARSWIAAAGGDKTYHSTLERYLDHTCEFLGSKFGNPICQLHAPDFAGLAPFLAQMGYSTTTISMHLKALRAIFLSAEKKGFVLVSPIQAASYITNPNPIQATAFTVPQIECLANASGVVDYRTIVLFGFYCAMDLVESANRTFEEVDFTAQTLTWVSHSKAGVPVTLTMPLYPVLAAHLAAVKAVAMSDKITPKLFGMTDTGLRNHFMKLIALAGLKPDFSKSAFNRRHWDLQFSSLKLAFAGAMGHPGLSRLARFIRSLPTEELRAKITKLPALKLNPLPLLDE
jgi:hypothetical protein